MNSPLLPPEPPPHTTVTRLTPAGRGAVATLAVEGPAAVEVVSAFFHPITARPLDETGLNRIRFGTWLHPNGDQEEIVVCRRGEFVIEIHCHGGDAAAAAIMAALDSRGTLVGDQTRWIHRHQQDPLSQAIRIKLAEARTQRTAGILLDQWHGAWLLAVRQLAELLKIAAAGAIAKGTDGEPTDARQLAAAHLARLVNLIPLGRHLTKPWEVVVVGPPNVGKSSLVNTMLGFSRCIVFDQPGTTRDIVATHTALDGWPVELMDTAGLREGRDPIETEGVQRALSGVASADLVIQVCDATQEMPAPIDPVITGHPNVLTVANKCDLVPEPAPASDVQTSAVTKVGVDRLIELIVCRLVPFPPEPGEAVPVIEAQAMLLPEVQASVASGDLDRAIEILQAAAR